MMGTAEGRWSKEARVRLGEILSGAPGLAAFDFDNTLIYNDLGEACLYYIALQGLLPLDRDDFWSEMIHPLLPEAEVSALRSRYAKVDPEEDYELYVELVDKLIGTYLNIAENDGLETAYRWTRIFFGGHTTADMNSIGRHVFEFECEEAIGQKFLPSGISLPTGIRVYPEIEKLIRGLLSAGWDVRVVTASPQELIQAAVGRWGILPEKVHGMRLLSDGDLLLPKIAEPMTYGPGKVQALRMHTQAPLIFAAGDSYTDWDLLTHAANALLIDRGKETLRADARKAGMIVQERFAV